MVTPIYSYTCTLNQNPEIHLLSILKWLSEAFINSPYFYRENAKEEFCRKIGEQQLTVK